MDSDLPSGGGSRDTEKSDGEEVDGSGAGSDSMGSDGAITNESINAINAYEMSEIEADFGYEDLDPADELACDSCGASQEEIEMIGREF